ncbi:MAG: hypothetical protein O3C60_14855 [Planctomycetota bacterium]|nr:hypothetical protein [Planctomycetota bacterium]
MADVVKDGRKRRRKLRLLVAVLLGSVMLFVGRPAWHVGMAIFSDDDALEQIPAGYANDASRLNLTRVAEVWTAPSDRQRLELELRRLLIHASENNQAVSLAGAQHSMGGQRVGRVILPIFCMNILCRRTAYRFL